MSLMGASELRELEDEASVITANVRSWIVRRNYIKVREAARMLENRWIRKKRFSDLSHSSNDSPKCGAGLAAVVEPDGAPNRARLDAQPRKTSRHHDFVKFQAASRGMLERKKLCQVKEQMLALLVISRNFRGRVATHKS